MLMQKFVYFFVNLTYFLKFANFHTGRLIMEFMMHDKKNKITMLNSKYHATVAGARCCSTIMKKLYWHVRKANTRCEHECTNLNELGEFKLRIVKFICILFLFDRDFLYLFWTSGYCNYLQWCVQILQYVDLHLLGWFRSKECMWKNY